MIRSARSETVGKQTIALSASRIRTAMAMLRTA